MVLALVALYEAAGGPSWTDRTNWLSGEPCIDGWYGVLCCPISFPILETIGESRRCLSTTRRRRTLAQRRLRRTHAETINSTNWIADPVGCTTGVITGTPVDYSKCTVVGLFLANNSERAPVNERVYIHRLPIFLERPLSPLSTISPCCLISLALSTHVLAQSLTCRTAHPAGLKGTLNPDAFPTSYADEPSIVARGLRDLQHLDVRDNALGGALPQGLLALNLQFLGLVNNTFDYQSSATVTSALAGRCIDDTAFLDCSTAGLPPYSCDAFLGAGGAYVVQRANRLSCTLCSAQPSNEPTLYMVSLGLGAGATWLFAMAALTAHIRPRSDSLRRWTACVMLAVTHVQTSAILGSFTRLWPSTVDHALACLSLSYTCFARSECLQKPDVLTGQLTAYHNANLRGACLSVLVLLPAFLAPLLGSHHLGLRGRAFTGAVGFVGSRGYSHRA